MKYILRIIGGCVLTVSLLAGCSTPQAALFAAVDACEDSPYIVVDEGGLSMETSGNESPGADISDVACVLTGLDIPDTLIKRIDSTNSLMGVVEGSWDVYEASWSYHPDNGLVMFIVATE